MPAYDHMKDVDNDSKESRKTKKKEKSKEKSGADPRKDLEEQRATAKITVLPLINCKVSVCYHYDCYDCRGVGGGGGGYDGGDSYCY